ncbi:SirB2 family protein [Dongshaea marina]|uniref:SirB2 family protein n=1 Tax=Dongshaea marina TaxID=2047966 RepID=UPI000D3E8247|nr:SirB2 family protein [Dongshaea marina]
MVQLLVGFHLLIIALTALLIIIYFIGSVREAPLAQHPWMWRSTLLAHLLLLLSGIGLCLATSTYPFTSAHWLTEKLLGIVIYLFLIWFALKLGRNLALRWFAFVGALGWGYFLIELTILKTPRFM